MNYFFELSFLFITHRLLLR